ncbi:MAG: hypothetical protein HOO67_07345 [Candidatus Peribacteraceae bacterium]|nr:hypothetical protein [Candidatus Peribacteraceae bacterium]
MKTLSLFIAVILSLGMFAIPAHACGCMPPMGMTESASDVVHTRKAVVAHPSKRTLKLQVRATWKKPMKPTAKGY